MQKRLNKSLYTNAFKHSQVAVIAGNLDLAEVIKNYKAEEVGESGPAVYSVPIAWLLMELHIIIYCSRTELNHGFLIMYHSGSPLRLKKMGDSILIRVTNWFENRESMF